MDISRTQTSALKGLAIVLIVMHNVIHVLSPVKENEFSFIAGNISTFLSNLSHSPVESLLSFYGWLGVSVFVFISGYGLTVKYGNDKFNPYRWLSRHYLRFILLLFPCYALWIVYTHHLDPLQSIDFSLMLKQQLLLLNLHTPEAISPGAYWYLGMAIQLYAWFLLLRRLPSRWLATIAVACWAIVAFSPEMAVNWLRYNSLGWMTEFVAGILIARHSCQPRNYGLPYTFVSLVLIILCSLTPYTFTLSGIFFVFMLLPVRTTLTCSRVLIYLGNISAALYVVHPLVRIAGIHYIHKFDIAIFPTVTALVILFISIAGADIYTRLLRQIR